MEFKLKQNVIKYLDMHRLHAVSQVSTGWCFKHAIICRCMAIRYIVCLCYHPYNLLLQMIGELMDIDGSKSSGGSDLKRMVGPASAASRNFLWAW